MLGSKPCSAKAQRQKSGKNGTQEVKKDVKRDVVTVNDFVVFFFVVCELFDFPSLLRGFDLFCSD